MFVRIIAFLAILPCIAHAAQSRKSCPKLTRAQCCTTALDECMPKSCYKWINRYCPIRSDEFKKAMESRDVEREVRRAAPRKKLAKCGTAERQYQPCTTRNIADKLFQSCCDLYVPSECHSLCTYETDQSITRNMLIDIVQKKQCHLKHLSTILYCASQNRNNRKCCESLDLNAPQLQVGHRCLRMCDPSGTEVEKITKDDVTCLYNWNVIMYCHHAGIREM